MHKLYTYSISIYKSLALFIQFVARCLRLLLPGVSFLFIVHILSSCVPANLPDDPLQMFQQVESLESVFVSDIQAVNPREKMELFDSLLFIIDKYRGSSFSIFNINTGEQIKRFGKLGKGVGEFLYPIFFQIHSGKILVHDVQQAKLFEFSVDSLLQDNNKNYLPSMREDFRLRGIGGNIYSFVYFNDGYLLKGRLPSDSAYIYLKNGSTYSFGKYHTLPKNQRDPEDLKGVANQGVLIYSDNSNHIVSATLYAPTFDIINTNSDKPRVVKSVINRPVDFNVSGIGGGMLTAYPNPKDPWGYLGGVVSSDRIYLLYSGKVFGTNEDMNTAKHLLAFDTDGNPIARYVLDVEVTGCLAFDYEKRRLYAITTGVKPTLVYFNLQ